MVKKVDTDVFAESVQKDGSRIMGVYLKSSEISALDDIAKEMSIKRHAVLQFAIRAFLDQWEKDKAVYIKKKSVLST